MATRAQVGIKLPNGTVYSIYNHFDGDIGQLGKKLVKYYSDPGKVQQLIELGDASFIDENLGEKIKFNDYDTRKLNKQCLFYGRDRGEKNVKAYRYPNEESWFSDTKGKYSYRYLFDTKTKRWAAWDSRDTELTIPGQVAAPKSLEPGEQAEMFNEIAEAYKKIK